METTKPLSEYTAAELKEYLKQNVEGYESIN